MASNGDLIAEFQVLYERLRDLGPLSIDEWTEHADRERCLTLREVVRRLSEISDLLTEERVAPES